MREGSGAAEPAADRQPRSWRGHGGCDQCGARFGHRPFAWVTAWLFEPTASDPDGDTLLYSWRAPVAGSSAMVRTPSFDYDRACSGRIHDHGSSG